MKLIGAIASPYFTRVVMFARLKGVDLPLEDAPGGSPRSEAYLAMTPIGKIPSLEVDGKIIPESEVICEYLEDAYPEKSGLPADLLDRATSRLIARIVDVYLSPNIGPLFRQLNPANRDEESVKSAGVDFEKYFGFLDHFMDDGPFCVGAEPTLGDCALAPSMMLMKKVIFPNFEPVADPTQGEGRLARWWQAIEAHPVCGETVGEYGLAVDGFMQAMGKRIINR
jgi:glutathione S-transferase